MADVTADLGSDWCPSSPRQKVCREGVPQVRSCLQELEAAWDRTWTQRQEDSPLAAFLQEEQVSVNAAPLSRRCRGD